MSTTITLALNAERSLFMVVYINYQKRRLQARVSASHSFNKLYDDTVPDTMTLTTVVWHESSAQSSTKP